VLPHSDSNLHLSPLPFARGEVRKDHEVIDETANESSMPIAFLGFLIHRDSMGQQHRVRIKRKRRLAYLRRKKASLRAAAARPASVKQQAQKESAVAE
jgi:hydroxyacyl-ACP dehydratase HTD2-like protein with hotdog domain